MDEKLAATPPEGEKAGHGNPASSSWGDVTQIIGTYNPERISQATFAKMERHYAVRVGLALIYLTLLKVGHHYDGPDPMVNAIVREIIDPVWPSIVKSCARTGVSRGCAPHELVYEHRDALDVVDPENDIDAHVPAWVISKVKDIDPASLQAIQIDGLENFVGYKLGVPSGGELEAEKAFHFVHEIAFGNWWGSSRLVGAYDPWYRHMLLWNQAMRYMERRGTPPTAVWFPEGTDKDGKDNSETARQIATGATTDDAAFWFPSTQKDEPGWRIEYVKDDQRAQGFLEMLNAHAGMILRSLMIPDLLVTQDGNTGSRALGDVHADMFAAGEEGLLFDIAAAVNDQIIPRIVRYNFPPDTACPRLVPASLSDADKLLAAEVFKIAVQGGQAPLAIAKLAEVVGIPVLDEEAAPTTKPPAPGEPAAADAKADAKANLAEATRDIADLVQLGRLMLAVRGER